MKKIAAKISVLIIIMAVVTVFSGCLKNFDVSRLIDDPLSFEPPEISEWEEKIFPTEVQSKYKGAYIDITPVFGEKLRLWGMEYVAQQILEASESPDLVLDIEPSRRGYKNTVKIYSANDQLLGSFELASDFMLYARKDKNSPLFLVPEYAYYTIEHSLWQIGSSLVEPLQDWEIVEQIGDARAKYDTAVLELRLAHDIKTILIQKYGVSEAYFLTYKIYTTAEYSSSNELTVRVYALLGYAGYSKNEGEKCADHADTEDLAIIEACPDCEDDYFAPDYHIETAAKMVYSFVDNKYYRMTQYSEPAQYNPDYPATLESRIRAIIPFEYMEEVMDALNDTSNIHLDIHRQAIDYLRISNQGDLTIKD